MQQVIEKITLVDAVGNRIPVPLQLCRTYSVRVTNLLSTCSHPKAIKMFAGIIKLYFEDHRPPGGSLVKRGHYQLVSGAQRSIIGSSSWELALSPGMMVEMSMVRHDRHDNTSCPRCGIVSIGWTKDEWATWYSFDILTSFTSSRPTQSVVSSKISYHRRALAGQ